MTAACPARPPALLALLLIATSAAADAPAALKAYVSVDAPVLVLNHVRVIDGTGAAPLEDQRIDIEHGRIVRLQSAKLRNAFPDQARIIDLTGKSVIPGLVGMHEHLFYPAPDRAPDGQPAYLEMIDSGPRLYLAGGVTTARTAGTMEPYADLALKREIDAGRTPGPKLRISGPYIGDYEQKVPQMHTLAGPQDAARSVDFWAEQGATSFKAYMSITSAELKAAIEHAHAKGLKITGHLCTVGFREAAALGIDDLEHGIAVDTEFYPGKKPGECPAHEAWNDLAENVEIDSAPVKAMIGELVARHVAVTSTLAVFEVSVPNRPPMKAQARLREFMSPQEWAYYLRVRSSIAERNDPVDGKVLKKEMQFERAFVAAGGLLLAGCDPTSFGGVLPGFGDQRGLELLVEAGFTPLEAIHIATQNGAIYLGEADSIGTISVGKAADLVVIDGNPVAHIEDVERIDTVFKDGLGYDPVKLAQSVRGFVGLR